MRPQRIEARALRIPFRMAFKHASAERKVMQSLWVTAHGDGVRGDGEGCPREYVTAESLDSALGFVRRHREEWCADVGDVASLRDWMARHAGELDANPAAWCAVELALLDLFGREAGLPLEALVGLAPLGGSFRYTAVLGDAPGEAFRAQLAGYLAAGFGQFKIKLSGEPAADRAKVAALHAAGIDLARVRADANNLWRDAGAALDHLRALEAPFFALEEPLAAGDLEGMRRIAAALGTRIILDESALRAAQLDALAQDAGRWIANVRVSKMGGVLRSLDFVRAAAARGVGVIVGAHVGETSLLTRAALTVASAAGASLVAQEGAFGTHLLEHDLTDAPLMFGPGGKLDAAAVGAAAGLGIAVRREGVDASEPAAAPTGERVP